MDGQGTVDLTTAGEGLQDLFGIVSPHRDVVEIPPERRAVIIDTVCVPDTPPDLDRSLAVGDRRDVVFVVHPSVVGDVASAPDLLPSASVRHFDVGRVAGVNTQPAIEAQHGVGLVTKVKDRRRHVLRFVRRVRAFPPGGQHVEAGVGVVRPAIGALAGIAVLPVVSVLLPTAVEDVAGHVIGVVDALQGQGAREPSLNLDVVRHAANGDVAGHVGPEQGAFADPASLDPELAAEVAPHLDLAVGRNTAEGLDLPQVALDLDHGIDRCAGHAQLAQVLVHVGIRAEAQSGGDLLDAADGLDRRIVVQSHHTDLAVLGSDAADRVCIDLGKDVGRGGNRADVAIVSDADDVVAIGVADGLDGDLGDHHSAAIVLQHPHVAIGHDIDVAIAVQITEGKSRRLLVGVKGRADREGAVAGAEQDGATVVAVVDDHNVQRVIVVDRL